jgi:hypothetical protein
LYPWKAEQPYTYCKMDMPLSCLIYTALNKLYFSDYVYQSTPKGCEQYTVHIFFALTLILVAWLQIWLSKYYPVVCSLSFIIKNLNKIVILHKCLVFNFVKKSFYWCLVWLFYQYVQDLGLLWASVQAAYS